MGWIMSSPHLYVQVLILSTLWWTLFEVSICTEIVKMRYVRMGPNPVQLVSLWNGKIWRMIHIQWECHVNMKIICYKSRREAWNRINPHKPSEEPVLWTPRFWTSSLQNFKTIYYISATEIVVLCYESPSKLIQLLISCVTWTNDLTLLKKAWVLPIAKLEW